MLQWAGACVAGMVCSMLEGSGLGRHRQRQARWKSAVPGRRLEREQPRARWLVEARPLRAASRRCAWWQRQRCVCHE